MDDNEPTLEIMKISDVKSDLSRLVNHVYRREMRIVVEKSGIPVAAIISAADLERFNRLERERAACFAAIDRAREAFQDMPADEIERETDRIFARGRTIANIAVDDAAVAE
jgi:prevent-host-death family protein